AAGPSLVSPSFPTRRSSDLAYTEADWSGCGSSPCAKTVSLGLAAELGIAEGDLLVATATDAENNTSEFAAGAFGVASAEDGTVRSEEHTSELQSREKLVCRL